MVEFSNAVKKFIPQADIQIGPGPDYIGLGTAYYSVFDISRATEQLGYQPKFDFEAGVYDYIETMKRLNIKPQYTP